MPGIPVVIASNGKGIPVKQVTSGAPVMTVATNGLGIPIVLSDRGSPFVVEGGASTAPSAFTAGQWSVADAATGGTATVTVTSLPSNGGSAITAIQYQVGAGAWTNSGISSTGSFNITGLTNGASVNIKIRAVNAIGNGPDSDTKSVTPTAGYDSDAQAYFNVMSPALNTARKDLMNPIFVTGKSSGWFNLLDEIRVQAQTGSTNYRVNLKAPTGPLLSEMNSPVFTDDRGVQDDAISAYLGTGYNFTDPNQFLQDAATVFCYINATPVDGNNTQAAIGMDTTAGTLTFLRTRDSTGGRGGRINATTNDNSVAVPSRLGFAALVRKSATTIQFYGADGLPLGGALTRASAAMQMKEMLLLRLGTIYCADRIAASGGRWRSYRRTSSLPAKHSSDIPNSHWSKRMTVQACMLMNPTLTASAKALNAASVAVGGGQVDPRIVDNPLANNLGAGNVIGFGYLPARLLNNPSYTTFYDLLKDQPIYVFDSDVLFLPEPEV